MIMNLRYVITSGLFVLLSFALAAQDGPTPDTIHLRNPSFEDMPRNSAAPRGWLNCGFPGETPPDVHPDPRFEFQVSKEAQHGKTYLGMVTRENETYEAVGQQLSTAMTGGQCYELDIQLARSNTYLSRSRRTNLPANYVTPIVLRVYGGYSVCQRGERIGQSDIVSNYDWEQYRLKLEPDQDYTHIILEVYYKPQSMLPYNGNVLLDNARPLKPIECEKDLTIPDEPLLEQPVTFTDPDEGIETQPVIPRVVEPEPTPDPAPAAPDEPKVKLGTTTASLKEGSIFRIENITFKSNSAELEEQSEDALQEIVGFLQENDNIIIEVGGHASYKASAVYANDLSSNRAKSVVDYLRTHSISTNRMFPKGYGKTRPVCMQDGPECAARNQRVEVKILRLSR